MDREATHLAAPTPALRDANHERGGSLLRPTLHVGRFRDPHGVRRAATCYTVHVSVIAHGIDLVENARLADVMERHADRFLERVLTPAEQAYVRPMRDPLPHIAGRFAAKEAVFKLLGSGWRGGVAWTDVEVVNDSAGAPQVRLSGQCAELARRRGIRHILLSISHTEHYAMASAIGLGDVTTQPAS